ncbi:MAG: hypothetical protein JNL12_02575 [Planctomycetes bacterium]|nr:hypothetical protein [Planctomycetota bacterium]
MVPSLGLWFAVVAAALATAVAASLAPLWVYALSLAGFGLPHVLAELRYVDERFAARMPSSLRTLLVVLLLAIAGVRVLGLGGVGGSELRLGLELAFGATLVAVPMLVGRGPARWLGGLVAASLGLGLAVAPSVTLVLFAFLHNLTPAGLLAERLRGRARQKALLGCAIAMLVVPLAMVTLSPAPLVLDGPLDTGVLDAHLPVFVPGPWLGGPFADRMFAVAAWLQCVHYALVLHVLPRLGAGDVEPRPLLPWPAPRAFAGLLLLLGGAMALAFVAGFGTARACYGVFAAVHAWLELPVLVLATARFAPRDSLRVQVA